MNVRGIITERKKLSVKKNCNQEVEEERTKVVKENRRTN